MSTLRIQCSPITGTIYAGRINKYGTAWAGQKIDVTSDVLGAVIQKVGAGNVITVNVNGKPAYEIEVRALTTSPQQAQAGEAEEPKSIADRIRETQALIAEEDSMQIKCALQDELDEALAALQPQPQAVDEREAWKPTQELLDTMPPTIRQYIQSLEARASLAQPTVAAEPDWSNSKTGESVLWKNPLYSLQHRLEIADGAVRFRDETIAALREKLAVHTAPAIDGEEMVLIKRSLVEWAQQNIDCVEDIEEREQVSVELDKVLSAAPVSAGLSDQLNELLREADALSPTGSLVQMKVREARALSSRLLPPDWVAVPREATPEMVEAAFVGMVEDQDVQRQMRRREAMADNYRKMIAAAPSLQPMPKEG